MIWFKIYFKDTGNQCFFSVALLAATAAAKLWECLVFFCFLLGIWWATISSSSSTKSCSLKVWSFVGLPCWLGPAPLCLILFLDLAVFWTGMLPAFFLLPFFTALTTSLANICNAFWIEESPESLSACFAKELVRVKCVRCPCGVVDGLRGKRSGH